MKSNGLLNSFVWILSVLVIIGLIVFVVKSFTEPKPNILDKIPLGIIEPELVKTRTASIWHTNLHVPWNETRDMSTTEATIKCAEIDWEYQEHRPWAKNVNETIQIEYTIHCRQWRD